MALYKLHGNSKYSKYKLAREKSAGLTATNCYCQSITIKIIQQYQMQWPRKQLLLHQNKEYNTRVVARIQRGDPRLRQFTFNNGCVRLFIYSPLSYPLSAWSGF